MVNLMPSGQWLTMTDYDYGFIPRSGYGIVEIKLKKAIFTSERLWNVIIPYALRAKGLNTNQIFYNTVCPPGNGLQ
jgi:hypothetical protein